MAFSRSYRDFSKIFVLFIIIAPFFVELGAAQNRLVNTNNVLMASLEKKEEASYNVKASNVVFPEILKGNEAETLTYIENFSNKKREYLVRMYNKGKGVLPKAASILKKYEIPEEMGVLLALESEYKANVISSAGAVGYWQIMDEVAGTYGLNYISRRGSAQQKKLLRDIGQKNDESTGLKDDRKNFNISTRTAARYLRDSKKYLHDDWLLVVASYNCGLGNVRKAIRKSGKANPDFWDIKKYLPAETRAYVMNFITLNVIFNNYDLFADNKLCFEPEKVMLLADWNSNISEKPVEY